MSNVKKEFSKESKAQKPYWIEQRKDVQQRISNMANKKRHLVVNKLVFS